MVSILYETHSVSSKVSSLIETVMTIAVMTPEGQVRRAGFVDQEFARLQRGLLSTFAHSAILGGFDQPYKPPQEPLDEKSTLSNDEEEQEEGEGGEEEGGGDPAGPSQIDDANDDDMEEFEDQCEELAVASAECMAEEPTLEKSTENSRSRKKKAPPGFVSFPEDFDNSQLPPLETFVEDEPSADLAFGEDPILRPVVSLPGQKLADVLNTPIALYQNTKGSSLHSKTG
jgi:hypothetical protein